MSLPIKISQLVTMSVNSISNDDFIPIVDWGSLSTQRVSVGYLKSFFETGSYTGSFKGQFTGTGSYANNANSSSYSLTSSYAEDAKNVPGVYEIINISSSHPFKVGHAIRKTKLGESPGSYGYTTCSITGDVSGSEAIGLIVDSGSNAGGQFIRICYQGFANFSDDSSVPTASYLNGGLLTGSIYFLTDGGLLTPLEPVNVGSITKPMFIAITTSSGLIINSRGIKVGSNLTTSSNAISAYQRASGFGMITGSLSRPPAYLRATLLCVAGGGDAGFNNLDELDLTSVFSTSSTLTYSSPFMSLTTIPVSSFTASFKPTSSWGPQATGKQGSIQSIDIGKWKLKIYS